MQKVPLTVYGVTFESTSIFCRALGYTRGVSESNMKAKYGTWERMAQIRLGTDNPADLKVGLEALKVRSDVPKKVISGTLSQVTRLAVRKCLSEVDSDQICIECAALAGVPMDGDGLRKVKAALSAYKLSLAPRDLDVESD